MSERKRCSKCCRSHPVGDFRPSRQTRDGLESWCRKCHNVATSEAKRRGREAERAAMHVLLDKLLAEASPSDSELQAWQEAAKRWGTRGHPSPYDVLVKFYGTERYPTGVDSIVSLMGGAA